MVSDRLSFSSLPFISRVIKKWKVVDESTPSMEVIDLLDFKFGEVFLRDYVVMDTLVTYFDEGIFG